MDLDTVLSPQFKYEVLLQGSYKNDTNLGGDSDVDVVIRLASKLKPRVVALSGEQLQEDGSHRFALERWQSFRDHAMKAMRARFGKAVKSGRKTIKVPKGKIPADADPVVMLITQGGDSLLSARRGTLGHGIRRVDTEGWLETHDSTSPT